jgi:hypothetical protein
MSEALTMLRRRSGCDVPMDPHRDQWEDFECDIEAKHHRIASIRIGRMQ